MARTSSAARRRPPWPSATEVKIEFVGDDGATTVLKEGLALQAGEVIDTAVMNVAALRAFYAEQIEAAKKDGVLLSLHLKATMMKISDPIMFGHCVSVYYKDALDKHADALEEIGANVNNGLADVLDKLDRLPAAKKAEIEADIAAVYDDPARPGHGRLAQGHHQPARSQQRHRRRLDAQRGPRRRPDVERRRRAAGHASPWCRTAATPRCTPRSSKTPRRTASSTPRPWARVANVGLMAQKAEEYGSHDKTFEAPANGTIRVVDASGATLLEQTVETGDIFRMCQVKDAPIRNWVKLAVTRARATGSPAIFWLDEDRAHDAEIITKVNKYLPEHDTTGLDIRIMKPVDAMKFSLERVRRGEDTIAVTGNVLRDYLTDLFPDPRARHQRQDAVDRAADERRRALRDRRRRFGAQARPAVRQGRPPAVGLPRRVLRAGAVSRAGRRERGQHEGQDPRGHPRRGNRHLPGKRHGSHPARSTRSTTGAARSTSPSIGPRPWRRRPKTAELQARFAGVAQELEKNEEKIVEELLAAQGEPVDIGGYYFPDEAMLEEQMRPSPTFNAIIDAM